MPQSERAIEPVDELRQDFETTGSLTRAFTSLRVPHFAAVYASGWLFSVARWGLTFLAAFVVNQESGSPRMIQLTGACLWGPLLFAGLVGGAISDRVDRRRTVLALFFVMAPISAAMGAVVAGGALQVWMVYPLMVFVGVGWVIDMTTRRTLVFDLVGPTQINNAMALEMLASASGLMLGSLVGGAVIELLGVAQAFFAIAAVILLAAAVMTRVPALPRKAVAASESFANTLAAGLRLLPENRSLVAILGVTVIVDFFYFPYSPLVQVIGERVGASPFGIGVLAASAGFGMMVTSLWTAAAAPHRGRSYVIGSFAAMILLLGFAYFESYAWVLVSLFLASASFGLFGATQGALTITAVPEAMRGRAMGLLSMAIGSLPFGMVILGELAEALGAPRALILFNLLGLVCLTVWVIARPEAQRTP